MSAQAAEPDDRHSDPYSELPTDPDVTDTRPLHRRPAALLWVFGGGIVGTALRYWVEELLPHDPTQWPWGTFLVNLAGAFLLGTLLEGLARAGDDAGWRRRARLFAGTGGCGAFTTYSTLSLEISMLGTHADVAVAAAYGLASVIAGAVLAWLGIVAASGAHARRAPV